MKFTVLKKIAVGLSIAIIVFFILCILGRYLLNKHSVPDKEIRMHNLLIGSGITDLTELPKEELADDIDAALSEYTNWDNLFLSDHFKEKYKDRKNILDDVRHITKVHSGITHRDGECVVIIFADKKSSLFDNDESDDITTEYYFEYVLNDEGEIDDLILIEKRDVYTINGMPVDEDAEYYDFWE